MTHLWMNRASGEVPTNGDSAALTISGAKIEKFDSQNIVGFIEGSDKKLKEEMVVYSAHYDHVGIGTANAEGDSIYNGSRDNAVGTVTVLTAAQNLAMNPTKRSGLFVLFTAEEKGLLGSQYYRLATSIYGDILNRSWLGYGAMLCALVIILVACFLVPGL